MYILREKWHNRQNPTPTTAPPMIIYNTSNIQMHGLLNMAALTLYSHLSELTRPVILE